MNRHFFGLILTITLAPHLTQAMEQSPSTSENLDILAFVASIKGRYPPQPRTCTTCQASFVTSSNLKRHLASTVHKQRTYHLGRLYTEAYGLSDGHTIPPLKTRSRRKQRHPMKSLNRITIENFAIRFEVKA